MSLRTCLRDDRVTLLHMSRIIGTTKWCNYSVIH